MRVPGVASGSEGTRVTSGTPRKRTRFSRNTTASIDWISSCSSQRRLQNVSIARWCSSSPPPPTPNPPNPHPTAPPPPPNPPPPPPHPPPTPHPSPTPPHPPTPPPTPPQHA